MTISNNKMTCKNNVTGYRMQPFYSIDPITYGRYIFRYFIDYGKPSTTMEIGVCDSTIFQERFTNQDTNCSNLSIRDYSKAYLFSWSGGEGRLYGNVNSGKLYGGYLPDEEIEMELDMRKKTLIFSKATGDKKLLCVFQNLPEAVTPIAYILGSGYETSVTLIDVQIHFI
jgi:hypothetical protein